MESDIMTRFSVLPSVQEKTFCLVIDQKPQKHGPEIESTSQSLKSPTEQMDDIQTKGNLFFCAVRKAP